MADDLIQHQVERLRVQVESALDKETNERTMMLRLARQPLMSAFLITFSALAALILACGGGSDGNGGKGEGRITFMSDRDGNFEIYVMDTHGSKVMRLTENSIDDAFPEWSPDGNRITFVSVRDGNFEIYVLNADGSGQTNLMNSLARDNYPTWRGHRIDET